MNKRKVCNVGILKEFCLGNVPRIDMILFRTNNLLGTTKSFYSRYVFLSLRREKTFLSNDFVTAGFMFCLGVNESFDNEQKPAKSMPEQGT